MPLLHLWAFVACYRVNFTFTFTFIPNDGRLGRNVLRR